MTPPADRRGLGAAVLAYGLWGVFPLYFHLLARTGALEIVAHRIWWSLVFCLVIVTLTRAWPEVRRVLRDRRLTGTLLLAGALVSLNWLIYIYAVVTDHVVDGALGYFINPLVTALLAVVFLRERLRRAQIIALGIGLVAVLVIVIGTGTVPLIGLGLAVTFGVYALAKNRVGVRTTPAVGLGIEVLGMAPLALGYVVVLEVTGRGTFTANGPGYGLLLAATGVVTAVPLLLFAVGAARLPLVTMAFIQYLSPLLQFLVGVVILHEQMPPVRWAGFALVWLALAVLSWDQVRRYGPQKVQRHPRESSPLVRGDPPQAT